MKFLFSIITWAVIASGCSSYAIRCDSHLRPINQAHANPSAAAASGAMTHTGPRHNP